LCLPMLFVSWLLLASRWAKMDAVTVRAPAILRQTVAEVVLQKAGFGKKAAPFIDRALRLDPANAIAWRERCGAYSWDDSAPSLKDCRTAVVVDKEPEDYFNLGRALDYANDSCDAEDSYTLAVSATASHPDITYVESMGRAALRCGHLPAAKAGLQLAVDLGAKALNEPDDDNDEIADSKKDMLENEEYLVIAYHRGKDDTLAGQACTAAHPGWKGCRCDLDAKGVVACSEVKR